MKTFADLFQGFGGATIGAMQAGYEPIWGIEKDAKIAAVAKQNLGDHIIVSDILDIDLGRLEPPDLLHASPPCPNFSIAKTGAIESESDLALARKVAEFVNVLRPRLFTLENVYRYRKSASWGIIHNTLTECGYWFDLAHINAADFGVPQTRRRMMVRAVLGGFVPPLPVPEQWQGWYDAIVDLLPSCPKSELAPWQRKRLPELVNGAALLSQGIFRNGDDYQLGSRAGDKPAFTITANSNMLGIRAVLVGGQYGAPNNIKDRCAQTREGDRPSFTVTASYKGDWRAVLTGDSIVTLTVKCLARLQAFPDWYELPKQQTLAARGVGNAVPPMLYKKLVQSMDTD